MIALGSVSAVAGISLAVFGGTALLGGDEEQFDPPRHDNAPTHAPATIDTSAGGAALPCQEISTEIETESSSAGDSSRPEGLIVAYEHAFFADRDAAQMAAMSIPSPAVATEEQLASSIENLAVDTPWCVNIIPAAEQNSFDVAVRFIEGDGLTVTTWRQNMTVMKDSDGAWKIVAVRGL